MKPYTLLDSKTALEEAQAKRIPVEFTDDVGTSMRQANAQGPFLIALPPKETQFLPLGGCAIKMWNGQEVTDEDHKAPRPPSPPG